MKKLLIFTLVVCMLLSFAACAASSGTDVAKQTDNVQTATQPEEQEEGFTLTYNDTVITMHAPADAIIAALGEPMKFNERPSCAFEGLDKTYFYGSFHLDTYPMRGSDFIYGWWFADDSISTEEGICIGSSQADVENAYGVENFNGTNAFIVKRGGGILTVILEGGVVSSIQYAIDLDAQSE